MQRILPDTNVLLGIRELDLLMRCHSAEVLKVVWCDELLAEFERKQIPEIWFNPGAESDALVAEARRRGLNIIQACSIVGIGRSPYAF